jgi:hypothetical protein
MREVAMFPGVLIVAPEQEGAEWTVAEVDADIFAGVSLPERNERDVVCVHATAAQALGAAYDILTVLTKGRLPGMHEHTQESIREFWRALAHKGYSREESVRLLLTLVDDMAERTPVPAKATGHSCHEVSVRQAG